jgi:hypothetical protein
MEMLGSTAQAIAVLGPPRDDRGSGAGRRRIMEEDPFAFGAHMSLAYALDAIVAQARAVAQALAAGAAVLIPVGRV